MEISHAAGRYIADLKGMEPDEAGRLISVTRRRLAAKSGFEATLSMVCLALGGDLEEIHHRFAAEIRPEDYLVRDERVVELMKMLGKRFALFIYTNNNLPLSTAIIRILGLEGLFRQVFTIEENWCPKPDRNALQDIYRRIGRTPDECLFVGDRYDVDLRLPAELGSEVCLVSSTGELFHLCTLMSGENV
jgi:putative hydrolase of the HAD superfamily